MYEHIYEFYIGKKCKSDDLVFFYMSFSLAQTSASRITSHFTVLGTSPTYIEVGKAQFHK